MQGPSHPEARRELLERFKLGVIRLSLHLVLFLFIVAVVILVLRIETRESYSQADTLPLSHMLSLVFKDLPLPTVWRSKHRDKGRNEKLKGQVTAKAPGQTGDLQLKCEG